MPNENHGPIDRIIGAFVRPAVDAVDINQVVGRVDVNGVIDEVDIDQLIGKVDVDAVIARVDVESVIERVDVDGIVERVDIDRIVGRVDIDALMGRVDIQALLDRVDLDRLMDRIDIDALIGRVDLDPVLARVDIAALMQRAGIDAIVRDATRGVSTQMIDLARRGLIGADLVADTVLARLLRRPLPLRGAPREHLSGQIAGAVSRLAGYLIDATVLSVSFALVVALCGFLAGLFLGREVHLDESGGALWWALGFGAFGFAYYWIGLVLSGRSIGKAVVGTMVVGPDGRPVGPRAASIRTVVYPFSFILGLGLIGVGVGRRHRALHDVAARTTVRYDWGGRPAGPPAAMVGWIERRDATIGAHADEATVVDPGPATGVVTGPAPS